MRSRSQRSKLVDRAFVTFKTSSELLQSISRLDELRETALIELNRQYPCDIYLCPVFPIAAPPSNISLLDLLPGYKLCFYWNILGMPAGVVPSSQVNIDETSYSDGLNDSFEHFARLSMGDAAGMPTGVQVVGQPNEDEKVLKMMRELQEKIKFKLPLNFE